MNSKVDKRLQESNSEDQKKFFSISLKLAKYGEGVKKDSVINKKFFCDGRIFSREEKIWNQRF